MSNMAINKISHLCITCEHHDGEHFHCKAKDSYVSYAYAFERNVCEYWTMSHNYKKGGKFYKQKEEQSDEGAYTD